MISISSDQLYKLIFCLSWTDKSNFNDYLV